MFVFSSFLSRLDLSGTEDKHEQESQVKANKRLREPSDGDENAEPCAKQTRQTTGSVPLVDKSTFSYMGIYLGFFSFPYNNHDSKVPLSLCLDGTKQTRDCSLLETNILRKKKIRPTLVRGLDLLGDRSLSCEDTTCLQRRLWGVSVGRGMATLF